MLDKIVSNRTENTSSGHLFQVPYFNINISSATEISAAIRQHKEGRRQGREKESIFLVFRDSALCNFAHVLSLTGTGY